MDNTEYQDIMGRHGLTGRKVTDLQIYVRSTRLFTLPFSLSPGGWLDYEDLDICEEVRNTMDSMNADRLFGLHK